MPRKTYKRRADGRYRIKHDGVPFYSSVGGTIAEVQAQIRQYEIDKANGLRAEMDGITVMEYAVKWLPIHRHTASTAAYNQYAQMLEKFCEHIGIEKRMRDVSKSDIIDYYNSISERSKSYITKAAALIRAMFIDAVDDGVIVKSPCRTAKRPEGSSGTHRPLESWEREIVHQLADNGHSFGLAAMLMLYAGLRRGEVLALDIDRDVDFGEGLIYVREAVSFSEGIDGRVKAPKTDAGVRTVPLLHQLRSALEGKHGKAFKPAGGKTSLSAFQRAWESYVSKAEELANGGRNRRWYGKTKEDLEYLRTHDAMPEWKRFAVRTHDFRHSYCTMICDAGVDIKTAMRWMGQSDATMIQKIYDHVTKQREQKAAQKTAEQVEKMLEESAEGCKNGCILKFRRKNA